MLLNDVINSKLFKEIPCSGFIYAVFKENVIFEKYELSKEGFDFESALEYAKQPLKELHCFDGKVEYRAIAKDSSRTSSFIEKIVSEEEERDMPSELLFYDEMMLEDRFVKCGLDKIKIVNRYRSRYSCGWAGFGFRNGIFWHLFYQSIVYLDRDDHLYLYLHYYSHPGLPSDSQRKFTG